ncbi:gas vesicle protein [Actinomadura sp. 9N215]|uniref:gas vesicle protein n=1 Tax=Actinomadura sp. 9N215 TaxID=3375150 RepID=UPI003787D51C
MSTVLDHARDAPPERIALVDLLDRLLSGGVVIAGDLVISIAGVDLVQVSLRALVTTVRDELLPETGPRHRRGQEEHP